MDRIAVPSASASGRWLGRTLHERVTLFVETSEVVVRLEHSGEEMPAAWARLHGASWRAGRLSLHLPGEVLQLSEAPSLDRAWAAVMRRACTLPEVARSLRGLGAGRGTPAGDHARFVAPLLQARRRLTGAEPVDWMVAGFDASGLAERTRAALAAMAADRHPPDSAPRRALEARLVDACEALFDGFRRVDEASRQLHAADDAARFLAWRAWAHALRALFADADRAWRSVSPLLAATPRGAVADDAR